MPTRSCCGRINNKSPGGRPGPWFRFRGRAEARGAYCAAEEVVAGADDRSDAAAGAELVSVAGVDAAGATELAGAVVAGVAVVAGAIGVAFVSAGAIGVALVSAGAAGVIGVVTAGVLLIVVVDGCEFAEKTR